MRNVSAIALLLAFYSVAPAHAGGDPGQCSAYATSAVAQNDEAVRRGCGFGGIRWQSNYEAHYGWCMVDGWLLNGTATESRARSEALSKCREKNPDPPGAASGSSALDAQRPSVSTQAREWTKWLKEVASGSKENVWGRYGNWIGQGWWGGSEKPDRVGAMPPVDDLDATGQKHDFGYEIAEELGRGREGVTGAYMLMADLIAIRDALALDKDPTRWKHPPKDPAAAKTYVKRLVIIFETLQTRKNYINSISWKREDVADADVARKIVDGLPDAEQFEKMQMERARQWSEQYRSRQSR